MMKLYLLLILVFLLGLLSNSIAQNIINNNYEMPLSLFSYEELSPNDKIKESQIFVYKDKVVLNINDAGLAYYADTNSMDPLLDKGANGIEIMPEDEDEINVGDVIAYKSKYGSIVHRVVKIGEDKEGWFAITKGDNNISQDPDKVRFEQIEAVLVGILY